MALTSHSMPADRRKPPSHKKASGRREDCRMQQEQPEDEKRETHNGKTRDGPYHTNRWYDPSRDIIVSVIVLYYQPCRHSSSGRHNVFFLTIRHGLNAAPASRPHYEQRRICPAFMRFDFEIRFMRHISCTDIPYFLAMDARVSPFFTL